LTLLARISSLVFHMCAFEILEIFIFAQLSLIIFLFLHFNFVKYCKIEIFSVCIIQKSTNKNSDFKRFYFIFSYYFNVRV
jgi:hypothetical protein